jgi:uncharacterized cupin superfamily protein
MTITTCPSFIDLASFSQNAGVEPAVLPLRGGPVEIAARLMEGAGVWDTLRGDTFLIVADGVLDLTVGGADYRLAKGESIVLSGPHQVAWAAQGTRVITMRYTGGPAQAGPVVAIDPSSERQPSGAPLAELLIGPTPQCRNATQFTSDDGEFMVGHWDSTPYHRRAMAYRHYELMYLLDGSVSFIDEEGREGHFAKGDLFLVEQQAQCSWESRVDVAKVYAIYRPAA